MATSKITQVEVLRDHLNNRTGKVGLLIEISKRGLWHFTHTSPPIATAPNGTIVRMTPAEDHPDHVQTPIGVGSPQAYWFIWNARGDGIDLLENDVATWAYDIPLINIMYGQEWGGPEPTRVSDVAVLNAVSELVEVPYTPSASPGFSNDPTWDAQEAAGTPVSGATDDQAGSTRARQRAPGMPQTIVSRSPTRNTIAEAPSSELPAIPITQPVIATEDLDGNLLEPQIVPTLTIFNTPDSLQIAPDIPYNKESLGISGENLEVPVSGRRSGTATKVPNEGSRTASLDPVPLIDYQGSVEGDGLVSSPDVDASADAQLLVMVEPRVIPIGQFAAVSLLVKNRHHSANLAGLGLYVEILFKDGTRTLIVNTPRNINIAAGKTAEASFHLQVSSRTVGKATITAAIISSDGIPMASISKAVVIAPETFDGWAMGSSGPTQFTDNDRIPNEVKQLIDASSPFKSIIKGSFYEHGQPQFFVVVAKTDRITASLQVNALAAEAGMTVRLRAGRMGNSNIMNLANYTESIAPMNIQGITVLPGTHLAAIGFNAIGGLPVQTDQVFWISVEPTFPIHSPQYNFGIHLSGCDIQGIDSNSAVRNEDGQLDGYLTLPWRSGVIALVNRRTTAAILLLCQDGTINIRQRAWPVNSTLVVEPEDVIEIRHGGAYNNFSKVHSTFIVDQETT